jgi:uncharacterized protein
MSTHVLLSDSSRMRPVRFAISWEIHAEPSELCYNPNMDRDEVLALLKNRKRALRKYNVLSLSLFGSVARNQARKKSDVDFLVEFSKPVGLFQFARLKMYLEEVLGHEVDLVTPDALRKELREDILREAIRAA